ncbi:hypothetical protein ANN_04663 [Periplaneta americana]|uniref:DUF4817 domain-containing protein n=1 Tax=Periplaneta americana TaxID=6978 RepID=A0ABQ8TAQ1_PERAM|nr:hypothetical protein ANN_04663 [Periplaneta americana]
MYGLYGWRGIHNAADGGAGLIDQNNQHAVQSITATQGGTAKKLSQQQQRFRSSTFIRKCRYSVTIAASQVPSNRRAEEEESTVKAKFPLLTEDKFHFISFSVLPKGAPAVAQVVTLLLADPELRLGVGTIPTCADYLIGHFPRFFSKHKAECFINCDSYLASEWNEGSEMSTGSSSESYPEFALNGLSTKHQPNEQKTTLFTKESQPKGMDLEANLFRASARASMESARCVIAMTFEQRDRCQRHFLFRKIPGIVTAPGKGKLHSVRLPFPVQVVAVKGDIKRHSDSSFRGEGYIQCCVGVRLCDMYSNQELAEIHFMYGKADGNAVLARRLYQERYPQRQCPDRKTFVRLHYRLCEYGKFNSPGLGRDDQDLQLQKYRRRFWRL